MRTDAQKAVEYFRKAAQQGHPGAQFGLGVGVLDGLGVETKRPERENYVRKVAKDGEEETRKPVNIGRFYCARKWRVFRCDCRVIVFD
jgi:TPR repeat protein